MVFFHTLKKCWRFSFWLKTHKSFISQCLLLRHAKGKGSIVKSIEKFKKLQDALSSEKSLSRTQLKAIIMRTLNVSDSHTVNSYITKLLAFNIINQIGETNPEPYYIINSHSSGLVCKSVP